MYKFNTFFASMKSIFISISLIVFAISFTTCYSQQKILYKQIDSTQLFLEVYGPKDIGTSTNTPAMIFFFGGGWNGGTTKQFEPHAKYFSKRGITCFLVEYRIKQRHGTTPFESLNDAKSSIRFIRQHAQKFQIDPNKIIASGGSAGGHLAAATALIENYNESSEDLTTSCVPNALVLFNPVIDNGPGGYGFDRIGEAYKEFSPLHNIKKGAPPTILYLGTKDKLIPVETASYYKKVMEKVGSVCKLKLYEDQGHGFFNLKNFDYYKKTVSETDKFLQSLGYLKEGPLVKIE
jgi:acetyl esterase/lipase